MIHGNKHQLPASKDGKGHYVPILNAIQGQFDAMLSHHCKVLVVRVDLHTKYYVQDNRLLSDFVDQLKRSFKTHLGQHRLGYIWCREQGEIGGLHYHLALLLDGNKNQTSYKIIEIIEEIWYRWEQKHCYTPKNCYYVMKRGDSESYIDAFMRVSYLAKVATKEERPPTTNDYSSSRIKPKVNLGVVA